MTSKPAMGVGVKGRIVQPVVVHNGRIRGPKLIKRQEHIVYNRGASGVLGGEREVMGVTLIGGLADPRRILHCIWKGISNRGPGWMLLFGTVLCGLRGRGTWRGTGCVDISLLGHCHG